MIDVFIIIVGATYRIFSPKIADIHSYLSKPGSSM
jgi:hypothetical protein